MHRIVRVFAAAAVLLMPACGGPESTLLVGNDDVFTLTDSTVMRERLHAQTDGVNGLSTFTLDVNRQLAPRLVTYEITASGASDDFDLVVVRDDSNSTTLSYDRRWVEGRPDVRVPAAMQALLDAGVSPETLQDHFTMMSVDEPMTRATSMYRGGLGAAKALFSTVAEDAVDGSVDLYLDEGGFVVQMRAEIVADGRTLQLRYDLVEVDGEVVSMAPTG